jgi:protein-S-isoprenylcysteine O-methyltransferase Ste14
MKRSLFLLYGIGCHLLFLVTFAWMAGFVGNLLAPKSIDTIVEGTSTRAAVLINLLLLGLFAVQHSVMARPAFKRVLTRIVPKPIERSTYVLVSCLVTLFVMWQWRGIDAIMWGLFTLGWLLIPIVSLMIDHFDLFGTRQVWLYFRGRDYTALPFRVPLLYKHVRHPLYIGWGIAFWATPIMTVGHLLFAGVLTMYMGLATLMEERDLIAHFGRQYQEYRRAVPMFVPRWSPRISTGAISRQPEMVETSPLIPETEVFHAATH